MKIRKRKPKAAPPAGGRCEVAAEAVANVYGNGFDKITRVVDTITVMHRRKQLDSRQHDAAQRYRWAFEAVHGAIRSSIDVQNFVPGNPGPRTPSSPMLNAAETLRESRRLLGVIDGLILEMVAGRGLTIEEATAAMCGKGPEGRCRDDDLRMTGKRLREALTLLSFKWWGPDRRAQPTHWRPEWARAEVLTRWGEIPVRPSA